LALLVFALYRGVTLHCWKLRSASKSVASATRLLEEYCIGTTLFALSTPAVALLNRLPDGKRIYPDDIAVVYVRRWTADSPKLVTAQAVDAGTALVFNRTDRGRRRGRAANLGEKVMALEALIILVIVGAIAGWLAGLIVKGVGFGVWIVRHWIFWCFGNAQ
jgi:hypothetical protein